MKRHIAMFPGPIQWSLCPPSLFGACGTEIRRPAPAGPPFEVGAKVHGEILPEEFSPLTHCAACWEEMMRRVAVNEDEWGNTLPRETTWFLYWIAQAEELIDESRRETRFDLHDGETILELERAVKKAEKG